MALLDLSVVFDFYFKYFFTISALAGNKNTPALRLFVVSERHLVTAVRALYFLSNWYHLLSGIKKAHSHALIKGFLRFHLFPVLLCAFL